MRTEVQEEMKDCLTRHLSGDGGHEHRGGFPKCAKYPPNMVLKPSEVADASAGALQALNTKRLLLETYTLQTG